MYLFLNTIILQSYPLFFGTNESPGPCNSNSETACKGSWPWLKIYDPPPGQGLVPPICAAISVGFSSLRTAGRTKAHHMAPLGETAWYSYCPSTKPRARSLWPLAEWSRPSARSSSTSRILGSLPQPPWSLTDPRLSDFALSLCTVSISQFVSSQCFTSLTHNMPLWKPPWYCCLPVLFTIPTYFITFYLHIVSLCIWQ